MPILLLTPILINLSYPSIFIWFLVFDNFIPILEELVLLSIGYSAAVGVFNPFFAILIAIISLSIVDNAFYFLVKSGSKHFNFIKKTMQHNLVIKYQMKMEQNLPKTFIILTFTPKIRFFAPVLAGALKTRWKKFIILDLSALILFVSVYVFFGFFFYQQITNFFYYLQSSRHLIFGGIIITLLVLSVFIARRLNKRKRNI